MSAEELKGLNKDQLVEQCESLAQMVATLRRNQEGLVEQNEEYQKQLEEASEGRLIFKRLLDLKADVNAVTKDERNDFGGWNFRGIDQMLNYFKPLMDKHRIGVTLNTKMFSEPKFVENPKTGKSTKHCNLIMEYEFFTDDGSSVKNTIPAEAVATDDKGVAKALSQGLKYLLIQGFVTPTEDTIDADATITSVNGVDTKAEVKSSKTAPRATTTKAAAKKTVAKKSSFRKKDVVASNVGAQDEL